MKKTGTVASLMLIGAMACSTAVAATGTMSATSIMWLHEMAHMTTANTANTAAHAPTQKARPASAKKKFRYLDMVERKHPSSIRNAVIVYDHADMKKQACDAADPASVSECLGRPSV